MRALVLIACLLCAVVVGAAYHYRGSWYDGSWLESWVQRGPSFSRSVEQTRQDDGSQGSKSEHAGIGAPAPSADSMPERVAAVLAASGVVAPAPDTDTETASAAGGEQSPSQAHAPERRARLAAEVARAVKAEVDLAAGRDEPDPASQRTVEAVANVVGDAVGTALADTVSEDETSRVADAVASAVAEAVTATGADATEQEVADAVAHAVESVVAEKQAEHYIARITTPAAEPVSVEHADQFVTQDQVISLLPEASLEVTTLDALTADPDLGLDTPITVVREVEQIEMTTPEKLIAQAGGELDRPVRILVGDEIQELTVQQVIQRHAGNTEQPIAMVRIARHYQVTTPGELAADASLAPSEPLTVVKRPYHLESATVAELLRQKLEIHPDTLFYIRTVQDSDVQGIWGIVFDSLVENFARGMSIRHGDRVETYRVEIPRDADELMSDRSSSFLGRMIQEKTMQSHVYNFRENRMGRNPDRIFPGQEIVIIDFQPQELIGIYKHFLAAHS